MQQIAKEHWQFGVTMALAVLDLFFAFSWRMVSIERFGVQIDYLADYSGPSPEEQYRNAYLILAAACLIAIASAVKLRSTKHLQWCMPLVLAFVSMTIVLMPR